jgi:hypothetical protein
VDLSSVAPACSSTTTTSTDILPVMQSAPRAPGQPPPVKIYNAVYSSVQVRCGLYIAIASHSRVTFRSTNVWSGASLSCGDVETPLSMRLRFSKSRALTKEDGQRFSRRKFSQENMRSSKAVMASTKERGACQSASTFNLVSALSSLGL